MEKEICINCKWWHLDPNATSTMLSKKIRLEAVKGGLYGKCRAEYSDIEGNLVHVDEGTLGSMECQVTDDSGNFLFEAVPED